MNTSEELQQLVAEEESDQEIKKQVAALWNKGKSISEINKALGIILDVPGSIRDVGKNLSSGNFTWEKA